jgi:hypothetical protein
LLSASKKTKLVLNYLVKFFEAFCSILTFLRNWFYIWIRNVFWKQTYDALPLPWRIVCNMTSCLYYWHLWGKIPNTFRGIKVYACSSQINSLAQSKQFIFSINGSFSDNFSKYWTVSIWDESFPQMFHLIQFIKLSNCLIVTIPYTHIFLLFLQHKP